MRINGQCHCGKIELEGTVDEANVMVFPLCGLSGFKRRLTEQLFFVKVKTLKLKKGRAKEYIKTTAESGNKRIQAFCGECGSQLYGCDLDRGGYNVLIGCLDQPDSLSVLSNIYLEHLHKNGYIIWTVAHGLKEALTAKPCDIGRNQFVKIYKHLRKAFLGVHVGDYKPCIIV